MTRNPSGERASMPPPGKSSSLTFRLNRSFFLRQLSIFFFMDLLLLLAVATAVFLWAEGQCAQYAHFVEAQGLPSQEVQIWMDVGGCSVIPLDCAPQGQELTFLDGFSQFDITAPGLRSTDFSSYYRVELPGDPPYAIQVNLSGIARVIYLCTLMALGIQALSLLCGLFGSSRTVRHTLRPLQDMAATAARLTSVSHLSRREMEALAGELDKISGMDLDSRIDLPATQKELRGLAQAINSLLERVNTSYRAQMQFVSDASHELRTPIAVIQGYSALLDRWGKSDPETRQESIDAIRSEAKAMERLVEQLLFLARGDNDSQPVKMELFDLTELAAEVLRDEILIHQERVFLPDWSGPVPVRADPSLIKQVMRVLMDNSVKYSAEDGFIWLRVSQMEDQIRVTVQDEGMGIPPEALPHIFDRFYRTDESRTRQTGGTGLGLSIAQWIVQRHGGWFEVLSREGFGSRITFVLPAMAEGIKEDTLT